MLKFLFAAVTVASPLVMLAAAARVFRLPYRNKWLWVILSFLGVATVSMDWATAQVTTQWIAVNLIGFGITQTPPGAGPWIWSFTIPIGAVMVFLSRPKPVEPAAPSVAHPPPPAAQD